MRNLPNEENVEKDWSQRGFSCGLWTDAAGQRWENFVHSTDELVMVIDGNVEFEIDGKTYHPQPGEELSIPAGVVHSVRNIGRSTSHWWYGYRR
jgi:quercetin dioxygenase-like cupin family protein